MNARLTILDLWRAYKKETGMEHASEIQRTETQKAFYSGFFLSLIALKGLADVDDLTEDDMIAHLQALEDEGMTFAEFISEHNREYTPTDVT